MKEAATTNPRRTLQVVGKEASMWASTTAGVEDLSEEKDVEAGQNSNTTRSKPGG